MKPFRVLLLTPPMVQFNAPYSATPMLAGYLRRHAVSVRQADLSLELALALFSPSGLDRLRSAIPPSHRRRPAVASFLSRFPDYRATVRLAVRFLQGRAPKAAERIASRKVLPEGLRFRVLSELAERGLAPTWRGPEEFARHLASLYLDDLGDAIREGADPLFSMARYGERLALAAPSFTPLLRRLRAPPSFVDQILDEQVRTLLVKFRPDLLGLSLPFPGNVYGAFRIAQTARAADPMLRIVAGGGYVNTELRALSDPRVFDFFDYIAYDDGEQPLLRLIDHLRGQEPRSRLIRTAYREGGRVVRSHSSAPPLRHRDRPSPRYDGLSLSRYPVLSESSNPMHRLWTERRWLKLQLAHGCYWRRCAFCDTTLDYIARFDPADPDTVLAWMEEMIRRTGETGFHFVDEAAPPALLMGLAKRIHARGLKVNWWANIRFERSFTPERAAELARSGCLAVTGGVECAQKRLLECMRKGVSPAQAARVAGAFAGAGVLVHAYLMYGFPGQTLQETVDGLEWVRQMFRKGYLHSAFWHRFALTVHSGMFAEAAQFGIRVPKASVRPFATNETAYSGGHRTDPGQLGPGLKAAVYNYMHGAGLDVEVRSWFDRPMPPTTLPRNAVSRWISGSGSGRRPA
jgi:radical SAM superfamily enzyme YgiQ (UPF0313 family)